jgi:hypothetical protein
MLAPFPRAQIVKLFKKIKSQFQQFRRDVPGERFKNLHSRQQRSGKKLPMTILGIALGIILIAGGILLGFVPGLPGIVLSVLGIGLIAAQFSWLANWCDISELALREFVAKIRHPHHY